MLTFISTRLATMARQQGPAPLTGSGALTAASSGGGLGLLPEVQQWVVAWDKIRLERQIGRGSFGRVYLASWNATPVAGALAMSAQRVWA